MSKEIPTGKNQKVRLHALLSSPVTKQLQEKKKSINKEKKLNPKKDRKYVLCPFGREFDLSC